MQTQEYRERAKAIGAMIASGQNYAQIAAHYGLTRERVRQIAESLGVKGQMARAVSRIRVEEKEARKEAGRQRRREARAEAVRMVEGGMSIRKAAAAVGLHPNTIEKFTKLAGVRSKNGRWQPDLPERHTKVKALLEQMVPYAEIARQTGFAHNYIYALAAKHRLQRRSRQK